MDRETYEYKNSITIENLQAEVNRIRHEVRRQRDDIVFAKSVADRLRGRSLSEDGYQILREAIEYARYHHFHRRHDRILDAMEHERNIRRQQIMEEKYMRMRERIMEPERVYENIFSDWLEKSKRKEKKKDFLEESDMAL